MQDHLLFTGYLGRRIHLGVTGSIAAYKAADALRAWIKSGCDVSATVTEAASQFVTPLMFQALGADPVYQGMFEGEDVVFGHLAPAQAAHAFVVAPATANTMAKLASGIADTMLTAQALAWQGPLVIAPAMNPRLWAAPATQANLATLWGRGHVILEPDAGTMACGEEGAGRLVESERLYLYGLRAVTPQDMDGMSVLVTLGPTAEPWDGVRLWTNRSSGRMGAAIALAAWLRGAEVTAVCGPTSLYLPPEINVVNIETAQQMHDAVLDIWTGCDAGCFTAAVADFAPVPTGSGKFKKDSASDGMQVAFTPNPDILRAVSEVRRDDQRLIGFAAESSDLAANARAKLERKGLDMIVANDIGRTDAGFRSPDNAVTVFDRTGREESWPLAPKTEIARRIWDWLLQLSA